MGNQEIQAVHFPRVALSSVWNEGSEFTATQALQRVPGCGAILPLRDKGGNRC